MSRATAMVTLRRASLPSAWGPPPPTVLGTLFTTPVVYLFFDRLARRAKGKETPAPFPVDVEPERLPS